MLFIQHLQLHYQKDMRYPDYAQVRNALRFLPINPRPDKFYPEEINYDTMLNCEVLFQRVFLFQENDGIKKCSEYFKKFNDEIFTLGYRDSYKNFMELIHHTRILKEDNIYKIIFCDDLFLGSDGLNRIKRHGHNEFYNNAKSSFSYTDAINETAFRLKNNEYGRIIFNDRIIDHDTGKWYYELNIYNFINCDKSEFKEKMFFRKNPDYEYKNMQYLKYC